MVLHRVHCGAGTGRLFHRMVGNTAMSDTSSASFFTHIRAKLRERSGEDLGGRYLAIILEQVIGEDPAVLRALFPKMSDKQAEGCRARVEWSFKDIEEQNRFADLSVFHGSALVGMVEIKENDHRSKGNRDQLARYRQYMRKRRRPIHFSYVTKHMPLRSIMDDLKMERDKGSKPPSKAACRVRGVSEKMVSI